MLLKRKIKKDIFSFYHSNPQRNNIRYNMESFISLESKN
jgi:hypothetical protein